MKNVSFSTAVMMCICTASLTATGTMLIYDKTIGLHSSEMYSVLAETNSIVKQTFYKEIDDEAIVDGVIRGYMSGLDDKYARYQSPEEYKESQQMDDGYFIVVGITVKLREDGYIEISGVSEGSASDEAGLMQGDIIIAVDGNDVAELGYSESVRIIKTGENDTYVVLTVKRGDDTMDISVKRTEIEIITAEGQMMDNNIGYIKINQFNHTTPDQMKAVFDNLISEGAEYIIFDLRNNPGGIVSSVEKCIDPFLPEGDVAVANYSNGKKQIICHSDADETDMPIAILINEYSASGAELFAAAMRDFGKAELVGKKSFGKGIMQNTYPLNNGGAITYTVATYQTTKSECYHGIGISPDYEVEQSENDDIYAVNPEKDTQLKKAVEVVIDFKK